MKYSLISNLPTYKLRNIIRKKFPYLGKVAKRLFPNKKYLKFRTIRDYFLRRKVAGYIGWIGAGNLGDEALWQSFKKLFKSLQLIEFVQLPALNALELTAYHKLIKKEKFYDLVFVGGGTLIGSNYYRKKIQKLITKNIPFVVFGTGVRDPYFWKKYYKPSYFDNIPNIDIAEELEKWAKILSESLHISVRGPSSAQILEMYGLKNISIIGDPALSICSPRNNVFIQEKKVGINIAHSVPMWENQKKEYYTLISRFIKHLLNSRYKVEFMPMNLSDFNTSCRIIRDYQLPKIPIWRKFNNIDLTLKKIKTYDFLMGQRLHSVVFSCGCGVPAISLEYRPKCRDFMKSIEMEEFCIRADELTMDKMITLKDKIYSNYSALCKKLVNICDKYRNIQKKEAEKIMEIL